MYTSRWGIYAPNSPDPLLGHSQGPPGLLCLGRLVDEAGLCLAFHFCSEHAPYSPGGPVAPCYQ